MKTDDLITSLALDLPPTSRSDVDRRVLLFMLPAAGVDRLAVAFVRALNRFTNTNSDPLE